MIKILFDMDGTLTGEESLVCVARNLGVPDVFVDLTREACAGCDDYESNLRRRVGMLSGFSVGEVCGVINSVPFRSGLETFIKDNRDRCAVVSSNLDCWCRGLVDKLGCDSFFSSAVVVDGRVESVATVLDKRGVVERYKKQGIRVIYVGDGDNDREAMEKADYSIAVDFGNTCCKRLAEVASVVVGSESQLVEQLKKMIDTHEI